MKMFLLSCVLALGFTFGAYADDPIFDIPYMKGVTIDGKVGDWGDHGFRVETLAGDAGEVREPQNLDAKFRLGWDEEGLLVLVTVRDDQIAEAEEAPDLYQKDGVEMFLGTKRGSGQFFQVLAGTGGADPGFPKERFYVKDMGTPANARKLEAEVTGEKTADGYMVEAKLPWKNLGIKAKAGEEVAFQLLVNDVDGGGPRLTVSWYPSIFTSRDSKKMMRVRLATKASPAVLMAARVSLDRGKPRVDVVAPAALARKNVAAKIDGKPFATSTFESDMGRAHTSFSLPAGAVEISCTGDGTALVDAGSNGIEAEINDAIGKARVIFKPCVFTGEKFPACDFSDPGEVEKTLGKCVLRPVFYDAGYHEVKSAATPGRYGAIVEVKTGAGPAFMRYVTLYRMPGDIDLRLAQLKFQPATMPPEFGIDQAVLHDRSKDVGEYFADLFSRSLNVSTEPAVLLAGLSEIKASGEPPVARNGPYALDQKWWYGLKQQTRNLRTDYYVHLPAGYETDPQKKWPMILFLHGSGERGYDISMVKNNGIPKNLDNQPEFPFIVIAPQCSPGEWWSPAELNALLDRVEEKYRVDTDRIYLTGLSMGGYGAWALAAESPERFAAVVPICGGGDPEDVVRIKNLPIWVFHGGKDPTVPIQRSQEMVDALKKAGSNVKFTIFPEARHDSWVQAYAMPELYEWLLQQKRGAPPGNGQ